MAGTNEIREGKFLEKFAAHMLIVICFGDSLLILLCYSHYLKTLLQVISVMI